MAHQSKNLSLSASLTYDLKIASKVYQAAAGIFWYYTSSGIRLHYQRTPQR
jgi:hypothetical protein